MLLTDPEMAAMRPIGTMSFRPREVYQPTRYPEDKPSDILVLVDAAWVLIPKVRIKIQCAFVVNSAYHRDDGLDALRA
jgi:hypothetical protein